jgi:hypothetical protein
LDGVAQVYTAKETPSLPGEFPFLDDAPNVAVTNLAEQITTLQPTLATATSGENGEILTITPPSYDTTLEVVASAHATVTEGAAISNTTQPALIELAAESYIGDVTLPQNCGLTGEGSVIDGTITGDETNWVAPTIVISGGFVNNSHHVAGIVPRGGGLAADPRFKHGNNTIYDCPVPRPRYNPRNLLTLIVDDAGTSWITASGAIYTTLGNMTPWDYVASKGIPISWGPIPTWMGGEYTAQFPSAAQFKAMLSQHGGEILCHTYSHVADHAGQTSANDMPVGADPDVYETLSAVEYLETAIGFPVRGGLWAGVGGVGPPTNTACTFDAGANTVVKNGHGMLNDAMISFNAIVGVVGIVADTPYYVVNKTTNTFQVALTRGGAAVDITAAGTGANYIGYKYDIPRSAPDSRRSILHRSIFTAMRDWYQSALYPESEGGMEEHGPAALPLMSRMPIAGVNMLSGLLAGCANRAAQIAVIEKYFGSLLNSKHMAGVLWFHSIVLDADPDDANGSRDLQVSVFKAVVDALAVLVAAGTLDILPMTQLAYTYPCADGEQPNLIQNPGFEYCYGGGAAEDMVGESIATLGRPLAAATGTSTIVNSTAEYKTGARSCLLTQGNSGVASLSYQTMNVVPGEQYEFGWWQKGADAQALNAAFVFNGATAFNFNATAAVGTSGWVYIKRFISIPKACTSLTITLSTTIASKAIYVDDLFLG